MIYQWSNARLYIMLWIILLQRTNLSTTIPLQDLISHDSHVCLSLCCDIFFSRYCSLRRRISSWSGRAAEGEAGGCVEAAAAAEASGWLVDGLPLPADSAWRPGTQIHELCYWRSINWIHCFVYLLHLIPGSCYRELFIESHLFTLCIFTVSWNWNLKIINIRPGLVKIWSLLRYHPALRNCESMSKIGLFAAAIIIT